MTNPEPTPRSPKSGVSLSIVMGTLLVPLSAVAAIWLTGPGEPADAATPTTTTAPVATSASSVDTSAQDLAAACGQDGMQLVSLEAAGKITDVQQAALDALRDICDQQGTPLPPAPETSQVVERVVVQGRAPTTPATPPASTTTTSTTPSSSVGEDDHSENDEIENDEIENEHHEDDHGTTEYEDSHSEESDD